MSAQSDVIVVGAGPVGLVTALLLARQGHRVTVVERWAVPYPLPRAIAMSHESLRILHWAGLTDSLKSALQWDERLTTADFVSSEGEVLLTMPFRAKAESGWPEMQAFNQPDVEALIEEQLRVTPGIELRRGQLVTALRQDAEGAEVDLIDADADGAPLPGAATRTLRAAFVIGCDGANSTVRRSLGVAMADLGFAYDWLVVDIRPTTDREWVPYLGQIVGPARPVTWAPAGPGRRRFEFMLMPGESREAMSTPEATWRLLEERGVTPANAELVRHAMYTFRAMWAEQWRVGRVLLAGDAAHLTPPFLAQGMNAGMRDAATAAWRLDLVLRKVAPLETLDDYGHERLPHARDLVTQAVDVGRMICPTDPQVCEERDGMLRYLRDNPEARPPQPVWKIGPGAVVGDDPHAAVLARQGVVEKDGRRGAFDDVCGVGRFVLLGQGADPLATLSAESARAWKQLSGVSVQVGGTGGIVDVEGTYAQWFEQTDSKVVLVRPDFYVFGTGATLTDADGLVRQLAQRLCLQS